MPTHRKITFTPMPDYLGGAVFEYTVSDGFTTASTVVAVTVGPPNIAPQTSNDSVVAGKKQRRCDSILGTTGE